MNIHLRPLEISDVPWLVQLRNDPEVISNIHDARMYPEHETEAWLRNLPKTSMRWLVYNANSWTELIFTMNKIGLVRIDNFDTMNRNCYVGMDIHKDWRGKGLANRIYIQILDKLFQVYNMETIYLEVLEVNERATHIYSKLGFQISGNFPNKILRNSKFIASTIMSLTKDRFYEINNLERKLS